MKGFRSTGYGPSAGFKFPARMGFTGSTGAYTNVAPHTRRKAFAGGGFVRQDTPRMTEEMVGDTGSAMVRRGRPFSDQEAEAGGRNPLRRGFKDGGGNWIKGAIKHPGAFKKKAKAAGMSTQAFASKVTKGGSTASATTKRQASLAKTLGKMHKADGGAVMGASPLAALKQMRRKPPRPDVASGMKGKFAAADGGPVDKVEKPTYTQAFKDRFREMFGLAAPSTGLARNAADKISGRQKQIDDIVDSAQTGKKNYSRGGKMKRMGYAMGGVPMPTGYAPVMRAPLIQARPTMMATPRMPMRTAMRSKGGMTRYADGGGVSVAQAKQIAQRTIGDHVRYPAPKGHKGLGAMIKR